MSQAQTERTFLPNTDLAGKTCLVVGGGTIAPGWGIGKAISVAYARSGAKVLVCDRVLASAADTVDLIRSEGGSAKPFEMDAIDPLSVAAAVTAAVEQFGSLDVLHNNVGVGKAGPSRDTSADDFRRFADANLVALHISAQAAIPVMERQGSGVILTTSTIASLRFLGFPHLAYGVTKAAANHFSRAIAAEYAGAGIRANTLIVGLMDTPRIRVTLQKAYGANEDAMLSKRNKQVPIGFMGDAWDVAHASVFLASDKARYISGAELVIDGALSATVQA